MKRKEGDGERGAYIQTGKVCQEIFFLCGLGFAWCCGRAWHLSDASRKRQPVTRNRSLLLKRQYHIYTMYEMTTANIKLRLLAPTTFLTSMGSVMRPPKQCGVYFNSRDLLQCLESLQRLQSSAHFFLDNSNSYHQVHDWFHTDVSSWVVFPNSSC